jgi:hypothetical protein
MNYVLPIAAAIATALMVSGFTFAFVVGAWSNAEIK